jgi:dipeptidyl aminopeptidase/acylaminoacyl peptidase
MQLPYNCPHGHEWEIVLHTHVAPTEKWVLCPLCGAPAVGLEDTTAPAAAPPKPEARLPSGPRWPLTVTAVLACLWIVVSLAVIAFLGLALLTAQQRAAAQAREAEALAAEAGAQADLAAAQAVKAREADAVSRAAADQLRQAEQQAREQAEVQRHATEAALQRAENNLYLAHIALAQREWSDKGPDAARRLLDDCPPQLRGWEWHYLRRLGDGKPLILRGQMDEIPAIAFSPDGQRLATASIDKSVKVWDVSAGKELLTFGEHTGGVHAVAFRPNGKQAASGGADGMVRFWDPNNGVAGQELEVPGLGIRSLAYSPDGRWLAAGCDKAVRVWDVVKTDEVLKLEGFANIVESVAFSPDGKRLAATGQTGDNKVKVWEVPGGKEVPELASLKGARAVAYSPDNKHLAAADGARAIHVWDAASGKELVTLTGHTDLVRCLAFSPDGKRLVSGSADKTLKVWDVATGQELLTLRGHEGPVNALAWSPDGQRIGSAGGDKNKPGEIRIWDGRPPDVQK